MEFEGASILSAMVAWNDTCMCTFEEALQTYESSLLQVIFYFHILSVTIRFRPEVFLKFNCSMRVSFSWDVMVISLLLKYPSS